MVGFESSKIFYYCATLGPSLLNILQSVIIGRVIVRTMNVICFGTLRLDCIDVLFSSLEHNLVRIRLSTMVLNIWVTSPDTHSERRIDPLITVEQLKVTHPCSQPRSRHVTYNID